MTPERLTDHYSTDEFERRHDAACDAEPILSEREMQFVRDIWSKYMQYGENMFFSEAQRRYLQMLAVRGGWRKHMDDNEECAA